MEDYRNLQKFIDKYPDYSLSDTLTYNSYRTWQRSEVRTFNSVSVTEILWLIIDANLDIAKRFYSDKMQEAARYGTQIHNDLEQSILWDKQLDSNQEIHKQYRLACIKESIEPLTPEETFIIDIEGLPKVTWTIDLQANIHNVKWVIDFKTSNKNRNFISVKSKIQICSYLWLSKLEIWWLLYLNQKWYTLKMLTDDEIKYYTNIWLDLIEYTKELFSKWKVINLAKDL